MDIERLMAATDGLLFPSLEDCLGMVAIEARATWLPSPLYWLTAECVAIANLARFPPTDVGAGPWAADLLELLDLVPRRKRGEPASTRLPIRHQAFRARLGPGSTAPARWLALGKRPGQQKCR